ncbi:MAG: hypothetical protein K2X43_09180 [Hyphomonadaceae bacterium]|nr:hypothetical protein [Hyphomonadaceae bacterium]
MTPATDHPFSDLTPEQMRELLRAARDARVAAFRSVFAALLGRRQDARAPGARRLRLTGPPDSPERHRMRVPQPAHE